MSRASLTLVAFAALALTLATFACGGAAALQCEVALDCPGGTFCDVTGACKSARCW